LMANATQEDEAAGPGDGARDGDAKKRPRSFWRELIILVAVALALAAIIRIFVIQAFYIPSASMENTLRVGDMVLVNKVVYHLRDVHRGDIVVFNGLDSWSPPVAPAAPSNPVSRLARWVGSEIGVTPGETDFVKRVIGLPGDHVACCDGQGRVTVDGTPLSERSYLYPGDAPSLIRFDVMVPAGELWVMGDHRTVSYDSREHRADPGGGAIPESEVIGRAFVVVWPLDRMTILGIPASFQQQALRAAAAAAPVILGAAVVLPLSRGRRQRRRSRRARSASAS
jgi:signal peptidase I